MKARKPSLRSSPAFGLVLDLVIDGAVYSMLVSSDFPIMQVQWLGSIPFLVVEDWNASTKDHLAALSKRSEEDADLRAAWDTLLGVRSEIRSRVTVEDWKSAT